MARKSKHLPWTGIGGFTAICLIVLLYIVVDRDMAVKRNSARQGLIELYEMAKKQNYTRQSDDFGVSTTILNDMHQLDKSDGQVRSYTIKVVLVQVGGASTAAEVIVMRNKLGIEYYQGNGTSFMTVSRNDVPQVGK